MAPCFECMVPDVGRCCLPPLLLTWLLCCCLLLLLAAAVRRPQAALAGWDVQGLLRVGAPTAVYSSLLLFTHHQLCLVPCRMLTWVRRRCPGLTPSHHCAAAGGISCRAAACTARNRMRCPASLLPPARPSRPTPRRMRVHTQSHPPSHTCTHSTRAPCLLTHMRLWPAVVVELTLNDRVMHGFDNTERRAYEQLIRKALRLPGPPALLLLHRCGLGALEGAFPMPHAAPPPLPWVPVTMISRLCPRIAVQQCALAPRGAVLLSQRFPASFAAAPMCCRLPAAAAAMRGGCRLGMGRRRACSTL